MTSEGSILGSHFVEGSSLSENLLAAVMSNIWANYSEVSPDVGFHLMKLENGHVGTTFAGKGYLVAACAEGDNNLGMLRGRLDALSTYFSGVFEHL